MLNCWAFHLFLSRVDVVLVPSVTSQRVCFKECAFQRASWSPEFTVSSESYVTVCLSSAGSKERNEMDRASDGRVVLLRLQAWCTTPRCWSTSARAETTAAIRSMPGGYRASGRGSRREACGDSARCDMWRAHAHSCASNTPHGSLNHAISIHDVPTYKKQIMSAFLQAWKFNFVLVKWVSGAA